MTAHIVPTGTTIERVYFMVPNSIGFGPEFESEGEALDYFADNHRTTIVEVRWVLRYPDGSQLDTPSNRFTPTLDQLRLRKGR